VGIYKQKFDYKYSLDGDLLILNTGHGQYKFKIESAEVLENVDNIAALITKELQTVEEKQAVNRDGLSHYARLLLATLNICEKYTKLEKKYKDARSVLESIQTLKSDLKRATGPGALPSSSAPVLRTHTAERVGSTASSLLRQRPTIEARTPPTAAAPAPQTGPPEKLASQAFVEQVPGERSVSADSVTLAKNPTAAPQPEEQVSATGQYEELQLTTKEDSTAGSAEPTTEHVPEAGRETCALPTSQRQLEGETAEQPVHVTSPSAGPVPTPPPQDENGSNTASSSTAIKTSPDAVMPAAPAFSAEPHINNPEPEKNRAEDPENNPIKQEMQEQSVQAETTSENASDQDAERSADNIYTEQGYLSSSRNHIKSPYEETFVRDQQPRRTDDQEAVYWQEQDVADLEESLPQQPWDSQPDDYQLPLLSFLKNTSCENQVDQNRIRSDAELLEKKLGYFGIKGEVMGIHPGPVITTYEYRPDPGIKISKIVNLADDLALALSAYSIRIVAPIPGKDVMGIEIPNIQKSLVPFIDIVTSEAFSQSTSKIPICLGKDIVGNPVVVELESMPHLLIAGATGTGKSVGLNAMITSILYKATPDEVRFLMIDPKRIELSFYNDIPHLLTPVITDMNKANIALQWMVREMDRRYNLLAEYQVRHIEQFNHKLQAATTEQYDDRGDLLEPMPYIVVIIDELADLMMTASRDIEFSLTRLAQMARAAGIHLILATQRPSVDVLTGIIKANFPTRISFQVSSKTDSRTIIDSNGAETLLGNGDMLFVPPGTARLTRVHGTYVSEEELVEITSFIKKQRKPDYIFNVLTEQESDDFECSGNQDEYDEKYNEALEFVLTTRQASISGVQRALRVGYNRAARIIDLMEKNGVVGPSDGIKPRKVLSNGMNSMNGMNIM